MSPKTEEKPVEYTVSYKKRRQAKSKAFSSLKKVFSKIQKQKDNQKIRSETEKLEDVAEMVTSALEVMRNPEGVTLIAIHNYMEANYDVKVGKQRETLVKKFLSNEYQEGRLRMVNDDCKIIDFNKLFNVVSPNE